MFFDMLIFDYFLRKVNTHPCLLEHQLETEILSNIFLPEAVTR